MEGKFQFIISTSKRTCHCEEMSINDILLNYLFSLLIRKMTAVFGLSVLYQLGFNVINT